MSVIMGLASDFSGNMRAFNHVHTSFPEDSAFMLFEKLKGKACLLYVDKENGGRKNPGRMLKLYFTNGCEVISKASSRQGIMG
jgi:hypothetical protein